jgi:hypothetical protein
MNAQYRSTMEDASVVIDGYGGDAGTGYFGIYDGHGGRNVAEFLRCVRRARARRAPELPGAPALAAPPSLCDAPGGVQGTAVPFAVLTDLAPTARVEDMHVGGAFFAVGAFF